jgi:hypothetical protein
MILSVIGVICALYEGKHGCDSLHIICRMLENERKNAIVYILLLFVRTFLICYSFDQDTFHIIKSGWLRKVCLRNCQLLQKDPAPWS